MEIMLSTKVMLHITQKFTLLLFLILVFLTAISSFCIFFKARKVSNWIFHLAIFKKWTKLLSVIIDTTLISSLFLEIGRKGKKNREIGIGELRIHKCFYDPMNFLIYTWTSKDCPCFICTKQHKIDIQEFEEILIFCLG